MDVAAKLERRVADLEAAYASVLATNENLTARAEHYRALYMELRCALRAARARDHRR